MKAKMLCSRTPVAKMTCCWEFLYLYSYTTCYIDIDTGVLMVKEFSYVNICADGNARQLAIQLYGGGTETTSTALNWAVLYTCLHPEVMTRVQEEIGSQIGKFLTYSYHDTHLLQ